MEKRPTEEQLAKYRKNAQDQSLSAEVRAKFQAVVDKFENVTEKIGEDVVKVVEPKKTGRKTSTTPKASPSKVKKSVDDVEKAKAEIKAKTGKTEAECESIIEQYRALRTKAQEGKRKAEQASADNKKRVEKLDNKGDIIEGTNEKTADAVIESTAKDVADKIEKQIEAVEEKAEKDAKAEVAKDTTKTPKEKKEAIEAIVDEQVKKKTETIVKRVVIDTSALLSSIATSLGKFDKDSQKEFLIKLRSDIDKLLAKYAFGGLTDGGVQVMNVQQSNLSSSSVNPSHFGNGGGIMADGRIVLRTFNGVGGNKNKTYKLIKDDRDSDGKPYYTLIEDQSGNVMAQGDSFDEVNGYANLMSGKYANGGGVYSSDELYELLVYDVETGVLLGVERFRAKNVREANEMGEEFEDTYKKRFRENLRFKVQLAPTMFQEKGGMMATGGVVGQEIVFDDSGEENTGVIKEITNLGDYIVKADDGRTLLAQRDLDVISLGAMRQQGIEQRKKRFGFFGEGGGVKSNSKEVREKVRQHILESVYDYDENEFDNFNDASQHLTDEFTRVADFPNNLRRFPNNQKRFQDYLQGIPFHFEFYDEDIEDFLNGLGINPQGKKYSADQMWNLYSLLIWREVEPTYKSNKMAEGGMTEHGLRVGDEIVRDYGQLGFPEVQVVDDYRKNHVVNLEKGIRSEPFRKGGITEMLRNRRGN